MSERRIDLNADVGEGFDVRELFAAISSANVACGGHVGDETSMRAAVRLALSSGVALGAHPSYEDRNGFGRQETGATVRQIGELAKRQVADLAEIAAGLGAPLAHVKPHGALYHRLTVDAEAAGAFVAAVAALDPGLAIFGFPGSRLLDAARSAGLPAIAEGFAERRYGADGRLVSRSAANFQLGETEAIDQALRLAEAGASETICIHSDAPGASTLAILIRRRLEESGFAVEPAVDPSRCVALPAIHVVGAAIVENGKVLLTRRSSRMSMPGKWEFPGGKVEPGEEPRAALAREIAEELGLTVEIGERVGRGTSIDGVRRIVLEVFAARRRGGEPRLHEHEEHGWFSGEELDALDWPEADLPILAALARRLAAGL